MHIGHSLNIKYEMGPAGSRMTLTETKFEKDLGVYTANDLKPAAQCDQAAAKATIEGGADDIFQRLRCNRFSAGV